MNSENKIRNEIFLKIHELYKLKTERAQFSAGTSYINYSGRIYDEREMIALVDASLDFWLTTGRYAEQFENDLAHFFGMKFCLLTNSGSSANLLAVTALTSPKLGKKRLQPGDEVITTACGFPTTLNPILQNNLVPVFLDVTPKTYNIRVNQIESAISEKTKAIIIPHTLGNPADLDTITQLVGQYDLWFVEDNCDALGSKYKGKYTGTFGHISTGSFYPAHHITTGEGGAVLTNDPLLKKIIASFRDWGRDCWCDPGSDNSCNNRFGWQMGDLPAGYDHKYIYSHIGYNLKLTDMQAAIGVEQLKKLPLFIERRKENFNAYYQALKKFEEFIVLPEPTPGSEPSWFGFPILVKQDAPFSRKDIVEYLEANRIATRMLFGGNLVRQPAYAGISCRIPCSLINTDYIMNNLFWIGVYPGIDKARREYIIKKIYNFFQEIMHNAKGDR